MYRYRQCRRTEPRATTRAYVSIRRASTPTSRCTTLCGNQSPLSTCVEASHHRYNEAAASVVSGSVDAVLDLYALVVGACGGPGYASCDGIQLPSNVHFTDTGYKMIANATADAVRGLLGRIR